MTGQSGKDAGPGPPGAGAPDGAEDAAKQTEPVIRDRRRVRATGKPAEPSGPAVAPADEALAAGALAAGGLGAELVALRTELDERTRDLQRVSAEYANYRKRVERDRALVGEQATANVLGGLLPVLDDLDRAREHGELVEGFAAVAEQLVATTSKFGLTPFGERGDPFDPNRHEAVAHLTSAEVTEPTCVDVLRRGYLLGDRLVRPAMVAVADPAPPPPSAAEAAEPAEPADPAAPPDQTETGS
ncbi:MAG: nucleotide exchange factor GrpE [Micromonosporaceae bacterium]|nr:nucleotide exchange factor GrpE [Micromonosporaceae bacterium]